MGMATRDQGGDYRAENNYRKCSFHTSTPSLVIHIYSKYPKSGYLEYTIVG